VVTQKPSHRLVHTCDTAIVELPNHPPKTAHPLERRTFNHLFRRVAVEEAQSPFKKRKQDKAKAPLNVMHPIERKTMFEPMRFSCHVDTLSTVAYNNALTANFVQRSQAPA